jgi:hypothetical protein
MAPSSASSWPFNLAACAWVDRSSQVGIGCETLAAYPVAYTLEGSGPRHGVNIRSAGLYGGSGSAGQDRGGDYRRVDVVVPQEFLGNGDVVAVCEQVRGERVAQCVGTGPFGDPHPGRVRLHGAPEKGLVQVVATAPPLPAWRHILRIGATDRRPFPRPPFASGALSLAGRVTEYKGFALCLRGYVTA